MARAQEMAVAPCAFRGDPAALALGAGHIAIGALCDLQRDHWPAFREAPEESQIERAGFGFKNTARDLDARILQAGEAASRHTRIRIDDRAHHPRDPGCRKRVCTRRGQPAMGARFQSDIGGGPAGALARLRQSHGLGVRSAAGLCLPTPDNAAVGGNDHTTDSRIGRNIAQCAHCQAQRMAHMADVILCGAGQSRSTLESSPTKVSKSFASRKFLYTEAKRI